MERKEELREKIEELRSRVERIYNEYKNLRIPERVEIGNKVYYTRINMAYEKEDFEEMLKILELALKLEESGVKYKVFIDDYHRIEYKDGEAIITNSMIAYCDNAEDIAEQIERKVNEAEKELEDIKKLKEVIEEVSDKIFYE